MRPFSQKEKRIIRSLLKSENSIYSLIDFIRLHWPVGQFEISTFQQVVRVHLEEKSQLDAVMTHIVDVLSLIKYLEYRGYLSSWDAFPMEDNTRQCGETTNKQNPYFLSDLSVASELLKYGNKKFTLRKGLAELEKRGFKSTASRRHGQVVRTLVGGFAVLAVIGLMAIYANYRLIDKGIRVNLSELQSENAQVLENQRLNQRIIDSLHWQNKQLIILTNQISGNTANTREIEEGVKRQNFRIRQLRAKNQQLYDLSSENHKILKKTDSLLNKIPLN